jgi:hypothetical protein
MPLAATGASKHGTFRYRYAGNAARGAGGDGSHAEASRPTGAPQEIALQVRALPTDRIHPDAMQPRKKFSKDGGIDASCGRASIQTEFVYVPRLSATAGGSTPWKIREF